MSIFVCPKCGKQIDSDYNLEDIYYDGENDDICLECYEESLDQEMAYWWPLYRGEVIAGFHRPKGEDK